jgi:hypothetical protein
MWRDTFTAMVEYGIDPGEAADTMLTVAGLMVAQARGAEAARVSLQAGADFMAHRERTTPEASGLH